MTTRSSQYIRGGVVKTATRYLLQFRESDLILSFLGLPSQP